MRLPFPIRPAVQSYLHHAYTTGILEALGCRWALANEYFSLEVRLNDIYAAVPLFLEFSPWTELSEFERGGLCSTVLHSAEQIARLTPADLTATLRELLARGRYAELYVDEYYIPPSVRFGRTHLTHQLLVVGHDEAAGSFSGVIYHEEGRFGIAEIPAGALCQAVAMQPRLNVFYTTDRALREIAGGPGPTEPRLDLPRLRDGLAGFLEPANSLPFDEAWLDHLEPGVTGFVYGRFCYEFVEASIRRAYERGGPIDLRLTRLIWERSEVASERAVRLAELGVLPDEMRAPWARLAESFHRVHLIAFQHNLDRQRRRGTRRNDALPILSDAAGQDRILTEQLLARLGRACS